MLFAGAFDAPAPVGCVTWCLADMTLAELGAIGELIGGIGVVVTLIYLAVQIHQNTKQQRFTSASSLWEGLSRAYDPAYLGDNMSAYRKGLAAETTSPDEHMTFIFLSFRTFSHFYQIFDSHRKGYVEDGMLEMNRNVLTNFLGAPGARAYWVETGRRLFPDDYSKWVDSLLADADMLPEDARFWVGSGWHTV